MNSYGLDYLNRRGGRVWVIPLAGTTIKRPSLILPAIREPRLRTEYSHACNLADAMNDNLKFRNIPGRVFPRFLGHTP